MIQITFGCAHVYTSRAPLNAEIRRLITDARAVGKTSHEIYKALRANKERHKSRCINLSEVRITLGLRS